MWLLIDDVRNVNCDVIARNGPAGRKMLALGGWEALCLDHDLGDVGTETGYDVLVWALENNLVPPIVQLVTANPVGQANMARALVQAGYITKDHRIFTMSHKPSQE